MKLTAHGLELGFQSAAPILLLPPCLQIIALSFEMRVLASQLTQFRGEDMTQKYSKVLVNMSL